MLIQIRTTMQTKSFRKFFSYGRSKLVHALLLTVYKRRISSGPFKDMRYISQAHGSALSPKLIGTYERELHSIIEEIADNPYERIVDVGSAEGYYAVGLTYIYRKKGHKNFKVYAYDINQKAQGALKKLALLNNVAEHIEIRTLCDHKELNSFMGKNTIVICDIEGSEIQLLNPSKSDNLYNVDMLVEVHDGEESYITDQLVDRFRKTHSINLIHFTSRTYKESPWWLLFKSVRYGSVSEGRKKGLKWMYLKVLR